MRRALHFFALKQRNEAKKIQALRCAACKKPILLAYKPNSAYRPQTWLIASQSSPFCRRPLHYGSPQPPFHGRESLAIKKKNIGQNRCPIFAYTPPPYVTGGGLGGGSFSSPRGGWEGVGLPQNLYVYDTEGRIGMMVICLMTLRSFRSTSTKPVSGSTFCS